MWIYPVDVKRANEFGQIFEKEKIDQLDDHKKVDSEEGIADSVKIKIKKRKGIKQSEQ